MPQSSDISRALSPTRVIARFAVRVALLRREPLFGAVLNHWDECAAFGALFALVHVVNELT
ncbi:hypothetical protein IVA80_06730 [Bradyrhizobium sp. 139]|uniref:hypothetical protein n=1 Tax=Bradyrhizobium sp. 139 TaxID=2782616 RepID=UPI001FF85048|nr:hypothetical protein [Bradyrhizobium sp. 139]MCK1740570.1 hypothetical protein [Bradyrhizobium sp. 139]